MFAVVCKAPPLAISCYASPLAVFEDVSAATVTSLLVLFTNLDDEIVCSEPCLQLEEGCCHHLQRQATGVPDKFSRLD
jgi:hypothetical protein